MIGLILLFFMPYTMEGGAHPNAGVDLAPPKDGLGYLPRDQAIVSVNPPPLLWVPVASGKSYDVEIHPVRIETDQTTASQVATGDGRSSHPLRIVASNSPHCLYILERPLPAGCYEW
jgi:hypothetical protein